MTRTGPARRELRALAHELFPLGIPLGIPRVRDPGFRVYLESVIANAAALDRVIRAFELIAPWLPEEAVALDWGCRHGFDSCLMRPSLAKTGRTGAAAAALAGALARLNRPLERVWPVRLLAANLYFVLRKVERI